MKHLELCNKGDYLKYQNADNDQIYVVTKDWKYNADMKFNALWVEKFNTGASIKFTDISWLNFL